MRIPYVPNPPQPTTEDEAAIVARISARRAPRPLQPLDLALLHSPAVADGWNSFLGAIRTRAAAVGAREREIAICRVAACNGAWYEWAHHEPLARAAGVSEVGMGVVGREVLVAEREGEIDKGDLSDKEWAVLRYADEMTRNVKVSDQTFEALRELCSEREVVEITATVAAYNCVSRFLVALDVGEKNGTGPDGTKH
ncbi:AhpD-like protein [Daldinia caldariorum]|uniref:AhpD-like protein n=1 Tax=Daldinia caldariorum TaxID=326644 RepID=UPI0020076E35|nr:AhpD-like protein [Daldinia caldariorum]KAI1466109.1 AhpD-like protein [Daldinia caldariorum]